VLSVNLLAIETATPQVGLALVGDAGLLAVTRLAGGRRHGETLAPAIAAALASSGLTPRDLTSVVVDVGPGLFTGLRVGLATAKALVDALGIPAAGITSLNALAYPHRRQHRLVSAVVDARRHEVFRALYVPEDGRLVEVAAPAVLTPAALAAELAAQAGPVLAVGDGAVRYAEVLAADPAVEVAGVLEAHPDPVVVAELGIAVLAAGAGTDATGLRPLYLRQADVRIGWEERTVVG
jgi:tRNA threonylcarbamoyladenosine biosynthesis protein TsaB